MRSHAAKPFPARVQRAVSERSTLSVRIACCSRAEVRAPVRERECSPRIPSLGCGLSIGADAVRIEEIALVCCHEPDSWPSSIGNVDGVVEKSADAALRKKERRPVRTGRRPFTSLMASLRA
jgi:hypothetical protein